MQYKKSGTAEDVCVSRAVDTLRNVQNVVQKSRM